MAYRYYLYVILRYRYELWGENSLEPIPDTPIQGQQFTTDNQTLRTPRAAAAALMGPLALFEPGKMARHARAPRRKSVPVAVETGPPTAVASPAPVAPPPVPPAEEDLAARLDAVPIGLPALMTALEAGAWITPAARRRHMDRFRTARGTHSERERQTLVQLAAEVGPAALQRAARAAAASALGLPHSGSPPAPSETIWAA